MFFKHQQKSNDTFQSELQDMIWRKISQNTQDNLKMAYNLLEKNPKDAKALYILAIYHKDGRGVKQNPHQARRYYQQAAEQGHAGACYELARAYLEGNSLLGVDHPNFDLAKKYADKGIELGQGKTEFDNNNYNYKQAVYVEQLTSLRRVMDNLSANRYVM